MNKSCPIRAAVYHFTQSDDYNDDCVLEECKWYGNICPKDEAIEGDKS